MNRLELEEKVLDLKEQVRQLIEAGEQEQRELSETETNTLGELRQQIADAESEIAQIDKEERDLAKDNENKNNNKEIKTRKEMRLVNLINAVVNNTVDDEMRSYVEGNKITLRDSDPGAIVAGQATYGQENVPEDKKSLDVAIRNASILSRMGATWFGNAVGDISLPHYSGSQVGWKGEIAAADDGKGGFSEVILTPKRLTAYVDVSKQFLLQDSNDAESILVRDLAEAIAEKLDETVFGDATGSTQPAGIFSEEYDAYVLATGETLADITYDNVLALEKAVEKANGRRFMFVINPDIKYALKGTQMASGLAMVLDGNELDGYNYISSNSVKDGGIVCMDPRDLAVAQWGGVEVLVDTTTRAIYGEVRLVVNAFFDAALRGDRIATEVFAEE